MQNRRTRFWIGLLIFLLALAAGFFMVLVFIPGWGSTRAEQIQALPGDDLFPDAADYWNHALTINAPPNEIWPWLIQMGDTRGAFYSYQFIENLLSGQRMYINADRIHPEWQNPPIGQGMIMDYFALVDFRPNEYVLAGTTPKLTEQGFSWSWLWALQPVDNSHTRLIVRHRILFPSSMNPRLMGKVMTIACYMMEKNMMEGIRERAEGYGEPTFIEPLEIGIWLLGLLTGIFAAVLYMKEQDWRAPLALGLASIAALFVFTYIQPPVWQRIFIDLALIGGAVGIILKKSSKVEPLLQGAK